MKDMHISSYKTAQKAGNTPVRDIQKCENEGHAYLSLQDRTKGWYAGETQKCEKRDTHVSPYKTAQRADTLVRNFQKYEHIKDTQLHNMH